MNNSKDKKLKNLNYKLLYTLPLVGIGWINTQQNAHGMFQKKQPTTTQTPSTSRSSITTATSTTTPTPTTSRLSTSALGSQSNLGAKPKTSTTSAVSTSYKPSKEELQNMKMSNNLGESLKILIEKAFYDKLESKISSNQQNFDDLKNDLSGNVKEVSSSIFRKKVYDNAYKTGKLLNHEDMKRINEASEDFGNSMSSIAVDKFKTSVSNFEDIDINTEGINKSFEKTRIILKILGDDIQTAADHVLKTQVGKFINSQE